MSEELAIIVEMASRLFSDHCTPAAIARAETEWPAEIWIAVVDSGLPLALVSEGNGGVDLGWLGAMDLARLAGEHALPVPFVETMAANWLLDGAGMSLPDGPLSFAVEEHGRITRVPWGRHAGVVVLTERDGQDVLSLLEQGNIHWSTSTNIAGEPRDTAEIVIDDHHWTASLVSREQAREVGAALRAAQLAGAMRRAADLTVRYATERVQFGRTLSKFQAIQQSLAVLATQASAAVAAADMAARALASSTPTPAVAIAKARASEAAGIASAIAHQVHGAIGFTMEHELQLTTRRLLSWRDEWGNEAEHYQALGDLIVGAGSHGLWPIVTGI